MNMSTYGNIEIGYHHVTPGGLESMVEHKVDANTSRELTKTLGINFSKDNDFTKPVTTTDGKTIYLRPDTAEELKKAAEMAKRLKDSGLGEGSLTVYQNGKAIANIDPEALLQAVK